MKPTWKELKKEYTVPVKKTAEVDYGQDKDIKPITEL